MTQYVISLTNEPNQKLSCNLQNADGDWLNTTVKLRTLPDGHLIADITVNDEVVCLSKICNNLMPLLPNNTLGGNIYFEDIYGNDNPEYAEFNTRYRLIYDTEYFLG